MKAFYRIIFLLNLSLSGLAQVPNSGFETLLSNGNNANWGNVYLFPFSIDSSGNTVSDSIIIDGYFYQSTTDANSGSYAIELRNAFNYTGNYCIAGAVAADEDSVFSGWGLGEQVPVPGMPVDFRFYYKFLSLNNDSAYASLSITDSSGNVVGSEDIILGGTSFYTYIYQPVYILPGSSPAFMNITFRTARPGGQCSYGSRLLIDDVEVNYNIVVIGVNELTKNKFTCYPNPTSDIVRIDYENNQPTSLKVFDTFGRLLITKTDNYHQVDISMLPSGNYIFRLESDIDSFEKVITKK